MGFLAVEAAEIFVERNTMEEIRSYLTDSYGLFERQCALDTGFVVHFGDLSEVDTKKVFTILDNDGLLRKKSKEACKLCDLLFIHT